MSVFTKLSGFFLRWASGPIVITALLVYMAMAGGLMSWGERTIQDMSGKKVQILDLCFSYTPEQARQYLSEYSPEARIFAAKFNLIADTIYPISYAFFFAILLAWVFKPLRESLPACRNIHLLPLAILIFDYMENICVINMLTKFPDISDGLIRQGSGLTSIKWILVGITVFSVLAGFLLRLWFSLKSRPA